MRSLRRTLLPFLVNLVIWRLLVPCTSMPTTRMTKLLKPVVCPPLSVLFPSSRKPTTSASPALSLYVYCRPIRCRRSTSSSLCWVLSLLLLPSSTGWTWAPRLSLNNCCTTGLIHCDIPLFSNKHTIVSINAVYTRPWSELWMLPGRQSLSHPVAFSARTQTPSRAYPSAVGPIDSE